MKKVFVTFALAFILLPYAAVAQVGEADTQPAPASTVGEPPPGDPTYMPAGSMSPTQAGGSSAIKQPDPNKFKALAGIPGFTDLPQDSLTLPNLIQALYRILIVIGALIAVLKITLAGLKYMGTDSIGDKSSAKEDIRASLLGLLLLLATVLIVETVSGPINLNVLNATSGPSVVWPTRPDSVAPAPTMPDTIPVKPSKACEQVATGSCGTEQVPVFKGSVMACQSPNQMVVSGQSTFRYMTESQCAESSAFQGSNDPGKVSQLVADGKSIYGFYEVRSGETQPTTDSLLEACKTAGGTRVVKTDSTYYYPLSLFKHYYGYTCTN